MVPKVTRYCTSETANRISRRHEEKVERGDVSQHSGELRTALVRELLTPPPSETQQVDHDQVGRARSADSSQRAASWRATVSRRPSIAIPATAVDPRWRTRRLPSARLRSLSRRISSTYEKCARGRTQARSRWRGRSQGASQAAPARVCPTESTGTRGRGARCSYSASVAAADGPSSVTAHRASASDSASPQHLDAAIALQLRQAQQARAFPRTPRSSAHRGPPPCACRRAPAARPARQGPTATSTAVACDARLVRSAGQGRARRPRPDRQPGGAQSRATPAGCCLRKKRSMAAVAARPHTPCRRAGVRSGHRGGRSISSMSSASSNTWSGKVSRWRTPVLWKIRSLRLSRCCCTLRVWSKKLNRVPAGSSSATSCQALGGGAGEGSPPARCWSEPARHQQDGGTPCERRVEIRIPGAARRG